MKRIIQFTLFSALFCVSTLFAANPVPRTYSVYWEAVGAPPVVWDSADGVPHVIYGYLVGYSVGYNRPPSDQQVFVASFTDYERATRFLLRLPNPVVLPKPVIAD